MIVELRRDEQQNTDLKTLADLVNKLQYIFVARPVPGVVSVPKSFEQLPLDAVALGRWFESTLPAGPADHHVLLTSRSIALLTDRSIHGHNNRISIISDHDWQTSPDETAVLFARHILKAGFRSLECHGSAVRTCICSSEEPFDCLCQDCEEHLRSLGYRDGVARLKESLNTLNRMYWQPQLRPPATNLYSPVLRLARDFVTEINKAGKQPFKSIRILLVLHFLSDLIPFVDALKSLGCAYENIHLIAKPYPYSRRDEVSHKLREKGVLVERASETRSVAKCAESMLKIIRDRLVEGGSKPILVIEDGGYFAPLLHWRRFRTLQRACIGVVEQTQKGINTTRKRIGLRNIRLPIMNVAESEFKKAYESPEIGRIAIQNICRFTPNTKLSGRHAVVFGFGSVGREVAAQLTNSLNMTVSVVDNRHLAVLEARHRKNIVAEAASSFTDLRFHDRAMLVIGTTGRCSIDRTVLEHLPDGAVIVSTSSDQIEIDLHALKVLSHDRPREVELGKHEYILNVPSGTKRLFLLAEGYPINFYGSESLPNDTIDPVMTLLLLGGIELALDSRKRRRHLKPGVLTKEINSIADKLRLS